MPIPVLKTKIYIPSPGPNLVSRSRLLQKLQDGLDRKLTLVSAPAGFGKTTLLSEWVKECQRPVTWLSLDENDNNLNNFLAYFIAALQKISYPDNADFGDAILAALQSPQLPNIEQLIIELINNITENLSPFVMILDDFHVISDPEINEFIVFLIDNLPPPMHLVLSSRADPSWPLARLRARRQMNELRVDDLRFTLEEVIFFLNETMGLALSSQDVSVLEARTEGWIAGLQMAAISMRGRKDISGFIRSFSGSNRFILDYLMEEVLGQQSHVVQEFLLKTSILERMTAPLCDAITGVEGSQTVLTRLEEANLFLVSLDDERRWYRYHHLFADTLQNRLRASDPNLFQKLHQRAAAWFEKQGFFEYAIRHAVAGCFLEKAAELLETNAISMLERGELFTLLDLIELLESLLDEHPWLSIYKSWALTLSGQLDQADRWRQKAETVIAANEVKPSQNMLGHIAAIQFYLTSYKGKADTTAFAYAQKALEYLPKNEQIVRSIVTSEIGSFLGFVGEYTPAVEALEATRRTAQETGNHYLELYALTTLSAVAYYQSQLHQSCKFAREALQLSTLPSGQLQPSASWALKGLGYIYYEWNDLEVAEKYTQSAVDLGPRWGKPIDMFHTFLLLAHIKIAKRDLSGAQHAFERGEEVIRSHTLSPNLVNYANAEKSLYWLKLGNLDVVFKWAQESGISVTDEISLYRTNQYLTWARVYLVTEQYKAALELLIRLQEKVEAAGRTRSLLQTLVLRALAHQALNDSSQALGTLERALALARPGGYKRIFVDEGLPMVKLLRHAGSHGIAPQYVINLLSEFHEISDTKKSSVQPLIEPLTEREMEVLRLIVAGLSNPEIAEELVIAVSTVKSHINHIYGKLDVNSRTQAVIKTQELKFL